MLVPFLGGKDFEYLDNLSKAPAEEPIGEKETHLDRGIKIQCLSTLPALHARHPNEWAIVRRPCEIEEVEHGRVGKHRRDAQVEHSQNLMDLCLFLPMNWSRSCIQIRAR